ncbi:MAG: hypothetical protein ACXAEU_00715 [Candidatus Hodarchaeales archaeon]|jgi:hypothetical protein
MSESEVLSEVVGLAVSWDEVEGPTIISEVPPQSLNDPINVSLQIYMASVTIFGQLKEMTRVEITIPILTVSTDHVVRVAFDSWPDSEVRGDVRPCYIAFIMKKDTAKKLDNFLSKAIWSYVDAFKVEKESYHLKPAWEEVLLQLKGDESSTGDLLVRARKEIISYTHSEALEDLKNASDLWETARDMNALWFAVKSAAKLEGSDHDNAGRAFFLAAAIHSGSGNNEDAHEYFLKAAECFENGDDKLARSESLFNAGIMGFRLENYEAARDHLLSTLELITDVEKKGRTLLYLALSLDHLQEHDKSAKYFEEATESAKLATDIKFAARIASTYAFRLNERAAREVGGASKNHLFEQSAKQRWKAGNFFKESPDFSEAASSFTLANKAYLQADNEEMAAKSLEEAASMFVEERDYQSAGKSLLDIASFLPPEKGLSQYLLKAEEIIKKVEKTEVKNLLLTATYRRMAKAQEALSDYCNARQTYLKSHDHAQETNNNLEVASSSLALANISFKLEDYNNAGTYFLEASKELKEIGEEKRAQVDKCIKNACIAFRRASQSYKQAGNVAIFDGDENRALDLYEMSINLLALAKKHQDGSQTDLPSVIKKEIASLVLKRSLFEFEQDRLTRIIERIKELQ